MAVPGDPGVVHEDVDACPTAANLGDGCFQLGELRYIAPRAGGFHTELPGLLGDFLGRGEVDIQEVQVRPFAGQAQGDGPADARTGSGDDSRLAADDSHGGAYYPRETAGPREIGQAGEVAETAA
jgi:hypothetical protein